jgi:hypothetical protein
MSARQVPAIGPAPGFPMSKIHRLPPVDSIVQVS